MDADELRQFLSERKPSPCMAQGDRLPCRGCAHAASGQDMPSGERPCCSCIRNPEREEWADARHERPADILMGDDGHARLFDPYEGTMYNGAPRYYHPMDNYVTLDQSDQEEWLRQHPEYLKSVRVRDGRVFVVDD